MRRPISQTKIDLLIDKCWKHHAWVKKHHPEALPPVEMPILWFGDLDSYWKSERRIITIGLNPSTAEFQEGKRPTDDSLSSMYRFEQAARIANNGRLQSKSDRSDYRISLNSYFSGSSGKPETAYKAWFSSWKGILHALDASFYSTEEDNTAVHTDFCTPLATLKKWKEVSPETKTDIVDHATRLGLWNGLVSALKPDLILTCIASEYVDNIIRTLHLELDTVHSFSKALCFRSPAHKTVHAFGKVGRKIVHFFAAPAGSPWKGWYKCQVEDFAREIAKMVWGS